MGTGSRSTRAPGLSATFPLKTPESDRRLRGSTSVSAQTGVGHLGHEKSPAGDIQQTGYWPGSQLKVPASLTVGLPNTPWLKSARQLVATIDALSAVIVGLYRRFIMDASPWRQPATTIGRQSAVQSWLPVYLCSSVIIVGEVNVVDF